MFSDGGSYILFVFLLGAGFIFLLSFLVEAGEKRSQFRIASLGALVLAVLGFIGRLAFALLTHG
jgi:hypothetical protein